jgi:hypothetical protein
MLKVSDEEKRAHEIELVGHVGVDTGTLVLIDPCYAFDSTAIFDELGERAHAEVPGAAVAVRTGYGDGWYPVYATRNADGRVIGIEIKFVS